MSFFPVGSIIRSTKFGLQTVEVLGYSKDRKEFYIRILTERDGELFEDLNLDVPIPFTFTDWTYVTDLSKALL
jgi:hypothetical protein